MGAIKKAFYLSASQLLEGLGGSSLWKVSTRGRRAVLRAGASEGRRGEGPWAKTRTGARVDESQEPAEHAHSTQVWPLFLEECSNFNVENPASTMKTPRLVLLQPSA